MIFLQPFPSPDLGGAVQAVVQAPRNGQAVRAEAALHTCKDKSIPYHETADYKRELREHITAHEGKCTLLLMPSTSLLRVMEINREQTECSKCALLFVWACAGHTT